ncbi:glycoside hydrolase family 6 protein [Streptomyces luteolus]|uniref:Glucanase n=1 Tax=Streptomyces luteolus TaxID=3043615 RepID=A0ABT6T2R2_9ACTN|nr:glycoside hydrolase family 6 protein [Streptomyces sp. B-S-A12]MDI3422163.1 glycoside hydrolase family 6 protein [Streptomyces sp. B-S-A12]
MRASRRAGLVAAVTTLLPCLLTPLAAAEPEPAAAQGSPVERTSGFYVDPDSTAAAWVAANPDDSKAAAIDTGIARRPSARWFGNWSGTISTAVSAYVGAADAADKLPVLVAYNIPGRDACGGHSGGGAGTPQAYRTWIRSFAAAIGDRPALVVVEPDSLGDYSCLTQKQIDERNAMLRYALDRFAASAPRTWTYLDAGNPGWLDPVTIAGHLNGAGATRAHGFSLNVSNYFSTSENTKYGDSVNAALSAYGYTKPYVVDTSRNGNGSDGEWCNPPGRRTGTPSRTGGRAEMLLWVKLPGESDGDCGVGTGSTAGQFLPKVAYDMVDGN